MFFSLIGPSASKVETKSVVHMIAYRARDADGARRTFGLEPDRNVHRIAVQVGPVGNRVTDVDPHAKPDRSVGGLPCVIQRHLLLHLHGTAHRPVDAVEHDQQRVAAGLDYSATMLRDRGVDQTAPQRAQPIERPGIVQSDQPAVADHVGIDHGDQPAPSGGPPG